MGWASALTRIGGWVAAPFTGGASLAVTEPLAAALDRRDAINAAEQAQTAGLDAGRAAYDQAFSPYMLLGQQSTNALSGLMGFGGTSGSGATAPSAPLTTGRTKPETFTTPNVGVAVPRRDPAAPPDPELTGLAALGRPARAQTQTQSSFVRMRDPRTGEQGEIPRHRLAEAVADGLVEF